MAFNKIWKQRPQANDPATSNRAAPWHSLGWGTPRQVRGWAAERPGPEPHGKAAAQVCALTLRECPKLQNSPKTAAHTAWLGSHNPQERDKPTTTDRHLKARLLPPLISRVSTHLLSVGAKGRIHTHLPQSLGLSFNLVSRSKDHSNSYMEKTHYSHKNLRVCWQQQNHHL